MLRLRTFGAANLLHDGESTPQRRRIALFALLAVAGDRGMSREKLLGYLWPESTADNARHSLDQLVYGIRRAYSDEVLLGASPLRINPESVSSDVGDFDSAISKGDFEKAVSLYRGPFLDGFYLPDAPEFERWATTERERLGQLAARAFEELAKEASQHGRFSVAADWLRKRAALDPLSAQGATLLMRALAHSGDVTSALQHAALYERLVRQELDSDPDPSVTSLAAELRAHPPIIAPSHPASPESASMALRSSDARQGTVAQPSIDDQPLDGQGTRARTPWLTTATVTALLLLGILGYGRLASRADHSPAASSDRIVVLPFRTTVMDSSLTYLGEGMVDLLSARFSGEGSPLAVNPRAVVARWRALAAGQPGLSGRDAEVARSLDAGELIDGELIQTGANELRLNGRVLTADGRVLASETVHGPVDSIGTLSDQLATELLLGRVGEGAQRRASLLRVPSAAIAAFLQGQAEYRKGHVAAARTFFSKALDIDSTFAVAAIELGLATGRLFQWNTVGTDTIRKARGISAGGIGSASRLDQWSRAMEVATRNSAGLSASDRALLTALSGGYPKTQYARQILSNWESAAEKLPDLPEAQFWLGHVLLFQGPAMGLADSRSRAKAAFQRALDIDALYAPALRDLIEAAAFDNDVPSMRALVRRYLAVDSVGDEADYVRWRLASATGDVTALRDLRARFSLLNRDVLERIRLVAQVDATSINDAADAIALIVTHSGSAPERQLALHSARQLALNRGRPHEAVRIASAKRELEPNSDLQRGYAIRDALFWDGDVASAEVAVRAFDEALAAKPSDAADDRRTSYMRFSTVLWKLSHGDTAHAADAINRLRRSPTGRDPQADVLDALLASVLNRPNAGEALARLDSVAALGFGQAPHVINLISARIHERRADPIGALAALRRGRWYFPPENLSTYLREEGRLALASGDRRGAIDAWTKYLRLRADPEPALKLQTDSVRAQLGRIQKL